MEEMIKPRFELDNDISFSTIKDLFIEKYDENGYDSVEFQDISINFKDGISITLDKVVFGGNIKSYEDGDGYYTPKETEYELYLTYFEIKEYSVYDENGANIQDDKVEDKVKDIKDRLREIKDYFVYEFNISE
jgi:hypothetical protein